ncbi:hypothetical protein Bca52824_007384 [Brassica carinata]|uniref:LIM zinc-binding domain-containing protein n=1 Tax=Brassica carinata TaxID=52824 RepID=A0A8X7W7S8_BRACI|nr:hypothetical protein Bca52824_007384 [Brassica carinata]
MAFTGTLDKCKACDKTVYVMDLMTLEGMPYHKSCFRCSHCNGTLVVHFNQLFLEKGNYNHVLQGAANHRRTPEEDKTEPSESEDNPTEDECPEADEEHES